MKPKPWTILTSHLDKSYRVFNLRTDRACSPRIGLAHDFFVMESSSWVNIIPLTPQQEVVPKPLLEIHSLIRTGVITHALVIAAFLPLLYGICRQQQIVF